MSRKLTEFMCPGWILKSLVLPFVINQSYPVWDTDVDGGEGWSVAM